MIKHNPQAWQDGFDAWQQGYDDAMYDGIDTSSEIPCQCEACRKAYDEGQQEATGEIFGRSKSKQIMQWIENYQSGKSGIYPYQVALQVCAEFQISIEQAQSYVSRHIREVAQTKGKEK